MIRAATCADIPRLIELGAIMHATTSYASKPYCHEKTAAFMAHLITGAGVIFAAEVNGEVVGAMAGGITDNWFNDEVIAYEFFVFIDPVRRSGILALKLILAFIEWARIKGATQVQMGVTTEVGTDGIARLYESVGLRNSGPILKMEL